MEQADELGYLFLPGRFQLFFTPCGFGSVVLTQARGAGEGSVPYTQRAAVKDATVPPPYKKLGRMTLAKRDELGDLVVLSFEPVKGFVPLLFQDWGELSFDDSVDSFSSLFRVMHDTVGAGCFGQRREKDAQDAGV